MRYPSSREYHFLGWAHKARDDAPAAQQAFEKALSDNAQFHHAKAQLALYDYKANGNEDAVISGLQQAVLDAKFQNVPALVNLAMMQMQRDSAQGGEGC